MISFTKRGEFSCPASFLISAKALFMPYLKCRNVAYMHENKGYNPMLTPQLR